MGFLASSFFLFLEFFDTINSRNNNWDKNERVGTTPSQQLETGYSTQSNVRVTAFFQPLYSLSRSAASIWGSHSLSLAQLLRRSSTFSQKPTARPAAYAAPKAVVSATCGRITGTPRMSAWNCMSSSL